MLVDELQIEVIAGKGGNGSVHFARRKYQPFGGPDGGDGGEGGSVVLLGRRDTDTLLDLRTHVRREGPFKAQPGVHGGGNLMIGARGSDTEIPVPLGTLAYDADDGTEIGHVAASGGRLVVAKGGRGGRGNPKFATGAVRAPKHAEDGKPGEHRSIDLLYRIYADTALLEPLYAVRHALLPHVAKRHSAELDYELYLRKPRWLRIEHEFQLYDVAFLPLLSGPVPEADADDASPEEAEEAEETYGEGLASDGMSSLEAPQLAHLFWPVQAVVNLLPLGVHAAAAWDHLKAGLVDTPLRRLRRLVVLSAASLFAPWALETEEAQAEILSISLGESPSDEAILAAFYAELHGGVVH